MHYFGYSSDLKNRITEHLTGAVAHTKNKVKKLIFYCAFDEKLKALKFEQYLKKGSGYAFKNKHFV